MAEQTVANVPHARPAHSAHPPHGQHPAHPVKPAKPGRRRSSGRLRRLIAWEWGIVLGLLCGLAITLVLLSRGPDARHEADAVVGQMRAAMAGKPLRADLSESYPVVWGEGRDLMVTMTGIPAKVCVLVSWDLYRQGTITVNGITPQRVSAARLVDLCNEKTPATIIWSPKSGN